MPASAAAHLGMSRGSAFTRTMVVIISAPVQGKRHGPAFHEASARAARGHAFHVRTMACIADSTSARAAAYDTRTHSGVPKAAPGTTCLLYTSDAADEYRR